MRCLTRHQVTLVVRLPGILKRLPSRLVLRRKLMEMRVGEVGLSNVDSGEGAG